MATIMGAIRKPASLGPERKVFQAKEPVNEFDLSHD
jgi:hypothetical protein